jgi:hypothetical protein
LIARWKFTLLGDRRFAIHPLRASTPSDTAAARVSQRRIDLPDTTLQTASRACMTQQIPRRALVLP